jgi:hypothetical protein
VGIVLLHIVSSLDTIPLASVGSPEKITQVHVCLLQIAFVVAELLKHRLFCPAP